MQHRNHAAAERSTVDVGLTPAATNDGGGLFVPETLLPSQHQVSSGVPDSPCRSLVRAVLERALLDAAAGPARAADRADALAWFSATGNEPFSFEWVATHLGFDASWMRERIRARFGDLRSPAEPDGGDETTRTPLPRRRAA
jgi:hypothetical protein